MGIIKSTVATALIGTLLTVGYSTPAAITDTADTQSKNTEVAASCCCKDKDTYIPVADPTSRAIGYVRSIIDDRCASIDGIYSTETTLPLTEKRFWTFKIAMRAHDKDYETYQVYICQDTKDIYDSIDEFFEEERALRLKTYGKLDEYLFKLLENMEDEETIEVSVWLKYEDDPDHMEKLEKMFSHIEFEYGIPITSDVNEKDAIQQASNAMVEEHIMKIKESFIGYLKEAEIEIIYNCPNTPSIFISVSKNELLRLKYYPEIEVIYPNSKAEEAIS